MYLNSFIFLVKFYISSWQGELCRLWNNATHETKGKIIHLFELWWAKMGNVANATIGIEEVVKLSLLLHSTIISNYSIINNLTKYKNTHVHWGHRQKIDIQLIDKTLERHAISSTCQMIDTTKYKHDIRQTGQQGDTTADRENRER